MRGNDFIFDCVHLLYYKNQKIDLNSGKSLGHFPASAPKMFCKKFLIIFPKNLAPKIFLYFLKKAPNFLEKKISKKALIFWKWKP